MTLTQLNRTYPSTIPLKEPILATWRSFRVGAFPQVNWMVSLIVIYG